MENTFGREHCLSSFHASLAALPEEPPALSRGQEPPAACGDKGHLPPHPGALIFGPPAFGVESTLLPLPLLALALTSKGKDGSNYGTRN